MFRPARFGVTCARVCAVSGVQARRARSPGYFSSHLRLVAARPNQLQLSTKGQHPGAGQHDSETAARVPLTHLLLHEHDPRGGSTLKKERGAGGGNEGVRRWRMRSGQSFDHSR